MSRKRRVHKPERKGVHYSGGPCSTCGYTRRYTSTRKCVNCSLAPAAYFLMRENHDVLGGPYRYLDEALAIKRNQANNGVQLWRAAPVPLEETPEL